MNPLSYPSASICCISFLSWVSLYCCCCCYYAFNKSFNIYLIAISYYYYIFNTWVWQLRNPEIRHFKKNRSWVCSYDSWEQGQEITIYCKFLLRFQCHVKPNAETSGKLIKWHFINLCKKCNMHDFSKSHHVVILDRFALTHVILAVQVCL